MLLSKTLARLGCVYYGDVLKGREREQIEQAIQCYRQRPNAGLLHYDDCCADRDGFMVWPEQMVRGCHFHCRACRRSGDIIKLISEVRGLTFAQTLDLLGLENPYRMGRALNTRSALARLDGGMKASAPRQFAPSA